jgi:hypothetical protein
VLSGGGGVRGGEAVCESWESRGANLDVSGCSLPFLDFVACQIPKNTSQDDLPPPKSQSLELLGVSKYTFLTIVVCIAFSNKQTQIAESIPL